MAEDDETGKAARPGSDWVRRMNQAKQQGTWFADREQLIDLPRGRRLLRFWVAFVIGFIVLLLARVVVSHLRRQTGLLDGSVWLAGMIDAFIPAVLGAALAAYPAHRYRPSKTGKDVSPG